MPKLSFVPLAELQRARELTCPAPLKARIFATLCRINTLYMIARAGSGHIGSSFSSLDIVSWLFLNELQTGDGAANQPGATYFSSKGHDAPGLYAAMIATGQLDFDLLHRLRQVGGLPGHPDVGTPFIETNTGSLGMGLSKAIGMTLANRLDETPRRIFVMTGDGELQEGQNWEALNSAANRGLDEITLIVDHNKIQSDTWVKRVNDLGDLEAKFTSFRWHVERCDGHDFEALAAALQRTEAVAGPAVIIADTIKGCGVGFMQSTALGEDEMYRYHSGAPNPSDYAAALEELVAEAGAGLTAAGAVELQLESVERPAAGASPPSDPQRLIGAYTEALLEQAQGNDRLVVLDADLILDCGLIPFSTAHPERFFECGIAEQDMVSQAGGLALKGRLPVVHSFACFLGTRANEQIYNNASERTKIIYVGSLAGLLPGGPGHSHQSVRDIAALRGTPGLTMIQPSCEGQTKAAVDYAVTTAPGSVYLRLVSIPCDLPEALTADRPLKEGQGAVVAEGEAAVLFAYGPVMLTEAYEGAALLRRDHGLEIKVIDMPWLNRLDEDWLASTVAGVPVVFTLDDHYLGGGQGEMIAAALAGLDLQGKAPAARAVRFGVEDIPACGRNDDVLKFHGLDRAHLGQRMLDVLSPA